MRLGVRAEGVGGTARHHELPVLLRFWPHGAVSRLYGVFNEEIGRPERAIIVVDAQGIVRYIDVHTLREVPDEEEIAEELQKLPISASG